MDYFNLDVVLTTDGVPTAIKYFLIWFIAACVIGMLFGAVAAGENHEDAQTDGMPPRAIDPDDMALARYSVSQGYWRRFDFRCSCHHIRTIKVLVQSELTPEHDVIDQIQSRYPECRNIRLV